MFPFAPSPKSEAPIASGSPDSAILAWAPDLRDAVERLLVSLVNSLQKMAGAPGVIEGKILELSMRDLRDVVGAHTSSGVACIVECPAASCTLLATLDAMLLHGLIELLCGGRGAEPPPPSLRETTLIDQHFGDVAFAYLAGSIRAEWSAAGFGSPSVTKVDRITAEVLGARVREVGCIDLSISLFGLNGKLRVVLPPAALDRFASENDAVEGDDTPGTDDLWSSLLLQELGHTPVQLDAYLDAMDIDLGSLAALQVGQIMALPAAASARASLIASGQLLFKGEIGQADDRYTLRIDDIVSDTWPPIAVTAPIPRLQTSESPRA